MPPCFLEGSFLDECTKSCWSSTSCVQDCIQDELEVPSVNVCVDCLSRLATCRLHSCLASCVSGNAEECRVCAEDLCQPKFNACLNSSTIAPEEANDAGMIVLLLLCAFTLCLGTMHAMYWRRTSVDPNAYDVVA